MLAYLHSIDVMFTILPGGICSSELHKSETHVLVIDSASGEKFRFAQKWKMKCATPEWIENCVEKNAVLATEDYPVPGGMQFDL